MLLWKIIYLILIQSNNFFFIFLNLLRMNLFLVAWFQIAHERPHSINRVAIHIQSFYEINVWKNCFYEYQWTFSKHQMWINLTTNNFQPVRRIDYNLFERKLVHFFLGKTTPFVIIETIATIKFNFISWYYVAVYDELTLSLIDWIEVARSIPE